MYMHTIILFYYSIYYFHLNYLNLLLFIIGVRSGLQHVISLIILSNSTRQNCMHRADTSSELFSSWSLSID